MSGSALADAAGSGKIMQTLMTKDGKYPPAYAAALTAVSSVLGPIIPPSIPLVLYALVFRHLHRLPLPRRRPFRGC
jgi:TRAP-type C4-dicarboxylate transport system permease large subunit